MMTQLPARSKFIHTGDRHGRPDSRLGPINRSGQRSLNQDTQLNARFKVGCMTPSHRPQPAPSQVRFNTVVLFYSFVILHPSIYTSNLSACIEFLHVSSSPFDPEILSVKFCNDVSLNAGFSGFVMS